LRILKSILRSGLVIFLRLALTWVDSSCHIIQFILPFVILIVLQIKVNIEIMNHVFQILNLLLLYFLILSWFLLISFHLSFQESFLLLQLFLFLILSRDLIRMWRILKKLIDVLIREPHLLCLTLNLLNLTR
jgi:hypothetical protein